MPRSEVFERRREVYAQLDARLASRTRFFAAAALTNSVLAQLFRFLPGHALHDSYLLLRDVGAILETANLQFAQDIAKYDDSHNVLDQSLICREQRLLQKVLDTRLGQADCNWHLIRSEVNGLLNDKHRISLGYRWLAQSRRYAGILHGVRTRLGTPLDFALESHRIHIGVGIIRSIRQYQERP